MSFGAIEVHVNPDLIKTSSETAVACRSMIETQPETLSHGPAGNPPVDKIEIEAAESVVGRDFMHFSADSRVRNLKGLCYKHRR